MKKIIFILLLIIPCFCWGQSTEVGERLAKTLEGKVPGITINRDAGKVIWGTVPNPVINDSIPKVRYVIDGVLANKHDMLNLKEEDIESIAVLKDSATMHIYGNPRENVILITTKKPKEEYEVIVFDAGFSSFLATQKSPAFYSESTLKAKNALMVNEWNSRHRQPSLYDSSIYEVNIDYNQNIDYGLGVEYQLYMFFRYMEKENNMSLIGDYYAAR